MAFLKAIRAFFGRAPRQAALWFMEGRALGVYLERYAAQAAKAAKAEHAASGSTGKGTHLRMDGSTAVVGIYGTILPDVSWIDEVIAEVFGEQSTSSRQTAALIRQLADDPRVQSIMQIVDSPGGHSTGLAELADAVAYAASIKPIHAYAPDLAASAALWPASNAHRFTAGRAAEIGSIGAYTVVYDVSKAFEAAGYEAKVISTGGVKGAGVLGTKLTEEQEKDIQRNIDTLGELFIELVAKGREIPIADVRKLATGQTWIGQEAIDRGLIDAVETEAEAFAALRSQSKPIAPAPAAPPTTNTKKETKNMNLAQIYAKLDKGEQLTEEERRFLRQKAGEPEAAIETRTDIPEDVRAKLANETAEREKLAKEVAELKEKDTKARYLAEADAYKLVPNMTIRQIAGQLRAADEKLSKEEAAELRKSFAATHEAMKKSALFETFGSDRAGDVSAQRQLEAIAAELRTKNASLTEHQAMREAMRQRPDLYAAAQSEAKAEGAQA